MTEKDGGDARPLTRQEKSPSSGEVGRKKKSMLRKNPENLAKRGSRILNGLEYHESVVVAYTPKTGNLGMSTRQELPSQQHVPVSVRLQCPTAFHHANNQIFGHCKP